jgi:tRNA-modifying protein YgfZ
MLVPAPMSFKENPPAQSLPMLAGHGLLAASGPQAGAFLQAQLMSDVAALAVGQWQWSGWLTAKGRVIALFALLRDGEESFCLIAPDFPVDALRDALGRFVFRSKVTLSVRADWRCAAQWDVPAFAQRDLAFAMAGGWVLDAGGDAAQRGLWLLPAASPLLSPLDSTDAQSRWQRKDLAHGLPRLPAEQREQWTPQMLSLQRLRAFSLKKGCYPGQEIVARTHFLGQAKRELALLRGNGLHAGAGVVTGNDGKAVGTVVCADTAGTSALAVIGADIEADSLLVAGAPAERTGLAGGLQRP